MMVLRLQWVYDGVEIYIDLWLFTMLLLMVFYNECLMVLILGLLQYDGGYILVASRRQPPAPQY
jgi:hypothetical protein